MSFPFHSRRANQISVTANGLQIGEGSIFTAQALESVRQQDVYLWWFFPKMSLLRTRTHVFLSLGMRPNIFVSLSIDWWEEGKERSIASQPGMQVTDCWRSEDCMGARACMQGWVGMHAHNCPWPSLGRSKHLNGHSYVLGKSMNGCLNLF